MHVAPALVHLRLCLCLCLQVYFDEADKILPWFEKPKWPFSPFLEANQQRMAGMVLVTATPSSLLACHWARAGLRILPPAVDYEHDYTALSDCKWCVLTPQDAGTRFCEWSDVCSARASSVAKDQALVDQVGGVEGGWRGVGVGGRRTRAGEGRAGGRHSQLWPTPVGLR